MTADSDLDTSSNRPPTSVSDELSHQQHLSNADLSIAEPSNDLESSAQFIMPSSQPLTANHSSQPPLPSTPASLALPPLPPGPSPPSEPAVKGSNQIHSLREINSLSSIKEVSNSHSAGQSPYLPDSADVNRVEVSHEQFGLEMQYARPFGLKGDQMPHMYPQHSGFEYPFPSHSQVPEPFFHGFPYFSYAATQAPVTVPPPMFPIPQANFNFPPPLLKQHLSPLDPHLKIGIPFPPPGYDSNTLMVKKDTTSHKINLSNLDRDSRARSQRRSRSKSPSYSSSRSSSRLSQLAKSRRRSRSRSYSRRKSRSQSRSIRQPRLPAERSRRSRSRTHPRHSRSPKRISRRSRSPSRIRQHSRSSSQLQRRSRSPYQIRHQSNSRRQSPITLSSPSRSSKRISIDNHHSNRSRSHKRDSRMRTEKEIGGSSLSAETSTADLITEDNHRSTGKCSKKDRDLRNSLSPSKSSRKIRESLPSKNNQENVIPRRNGETALSSHRHRSKSERESLVERWRLNNCKNLEEMANKLDVLSKMEADEIIELEKQTWTRSAPADLYYKRHPHHPNLMEASQKLLELCEQFDMELIQRAERERKKFPAEQPLPSKAKFRMCRHTKEENSSSSSSCEDSSSDEEDKAMMELERKRKHPQRLHPELWHNDVGEMNDGPLCRCSHRARRSGIRHNVYVGEQKLEKCNVNSNNAGKLHHYRITMSPPVNFLTKTPTIIEHDSHEYIFEGFSMLSHFPLVKLPTCKVIRFNIEYTILYVDESMPENFTIRELDLFYNYLFHEVLELIDLDLRAFGDPGGCNQFHFMPRFVRDLPENGKEILSMNEVLKYLLKSSKPLVPEERLNEIYNMPLYDWQTFADEVKCMVVTKPGMKPCSLRVDQLDRDTMDEGRFPEIVHFGIRPPQLSYAGNTEYQKHWREYVKFRHLLANMPKPSPEDKRKLMGKENRLQEMRTVSKMKRDVTIALSSQGFYRTGIMCDIIQHALLLPVLVCHLRFHKSLDQLEEDMDYKFKNRYLLQLALTHPSYRENFGTNPDHARNSLTNCGIRQPEYGDRRIHYMNTRKRGINTLIQIMSRFGKKEATESNIGHNERLEFLGDAVVEFITSIHLFHLFSDLEEGGLATYRAAIVQNQHLAVMAKRLNLDAYMLYAHGSDLCHDLELRHAMANCFEALMGALFLDGGIEVADKVFGCTLWKEQQNLTDVWMNYPLHPLQEQEPAGDRQWIQHFPVLQKLTEFEERTCIKFKHIRLLARAFTDRSVGYTNLTLGSNQRLEFLGDTVLQIIASEYLYKFFPEHHEGHLSLLRSSLVNNRTQAVVCDDLGMTEFALYANPKHDIKTKDRADLLEAFLGALYIDKGLKHCHLFCEVCFFPRLQDFIMNQDWNDPKSKLQQCCLTLRTMEGGEPDIPVYKVIQCMGPTNTRIYTVAVYFRGERLAQASGHSIQQAEMNAANEALELSTELFPQLDHQRRVIAKSMKKQKKRARREAALKAARDLEIRAGEARSRTREKNHRGLHQHRSHQMQDKDRARPRLSSPDRDSRQSGKEKLSQKRDIRDREVSRHDNRDDRVSKRESRERDSRKYDRNRDVESRERDLLRDIQLRSRHKESLGKDFRGRDHRRDHRGGDRQSDGRNRGSTGMDWKKESRRGRDRDHRDSFCKERDARGKLEERVSISESRRTSKEKTVMRERYYSKDYEASVSKDVRKQGSSGGQLECDSNGGKVNKSKANALIRCPKKKIRLDLNGAEEQKESSEMLRNLPTYKSCPSHEVYDKGLRPVSPDTLSCQSIISDDSLSSEYSGTSRHVISPKSPSLSVSSKGSSNGSVAGIDDLLQDVEDEQFFSNHSPDPHFIRFSCIEETETCLDKPDTEFRYESEQSSCNSTIDDLKETTSDDEIQHDLP